MKKLIILSGGVGSRLWPVSRKSLPKQFISFRDDGCLLQNTLKRFLEFKEYSIIVVTGATQRALINKHLEQEGIAPETIIIEPEGRNTAPAILAAALYVMESDPEALLLVTPSDHMIQDASAFHTALETAIVEAEAGQILTFGVKPNRPETGYGYLELHQQPLINQPQPLVRFVEKPSLNKAQKMLAKGNYLWNAGIFMFRANIILQAYKQHAPHLLLPVHAALEKGERDGYCLFLDKESWMQAGDISIDYAVMEKASNLSVIPMDCGWTDLGDWDSVARALPKDQEGNTVSNGALALSCQNTLLRSEEPNIKLVGIGLKDMVAVATSDAVLVASRKHTQDVKRAVEILKQQGARQVSEFPYDHRPWGWFECVCKGEKFQVKRIVVNPRGILSLQSHNHRAEHWVVVEGEALVTIGDDTKIVRANQSVYIPVGEKHRLENPGTKPLVLIEVQTGDYLGEDDIIRYEDVYGRK